MVHKFEQGALLALKYPLTQLESGFFLGKKTLQNVCGL